VREGNTGTSGGFGMMKTLFTPMGTGNRQSLPPLAAVGGKGRSLYWLATNGFPVPPTWVLSTASFNLTVEQARLEGQESGEISRTEAEGFLPSSGKRIQATVIGKDRPPRVSRPAIRRSTIALGVEGREPVGMSKRVSVSQGRVYCWMHVINGKGEAIIVRWIGEKGKRIADVDLRVGSNSWRTWSYLSLRPSMIGSAQVEIRDENGEILETLSFEITE